MAKISHMTINTRLVLVPFAAAAIALTSCSAPPAASTESGTAEDAVVNERTPTAPEPALASSVEASINENFPGGITSSSPLFAVTQYEDVSPGTVRVYVQENLEKDERETIARQVFNLGSDGSGALKTVVVRDASEKDSNHRR